jgi:Animal haem peroxidase
MSPASLRSHCLSAARLRPSQGVEAGPAGYIRLFPDLPSLEADESLLHAIGRADGLCDTGCFDDSPESLSETAAGWPIFGQFVAHDITADRSALQSHVDPRGLRNSRTPRLNLEGLYGDGPVGHPFLYQREDPAKFLLSAGSTDLPRNAEGTALVGDPRNDSHMLMAQLHLTMLGVHNALVNGLRRQGVPEGRVFESAANELRWHYQWIVLDEFLPSLVGRPLVEEILTDGPRWFRPIGDAAIPLEFADAAYRYGHCQIRHKYRLNLNTEPVPVFPDLLGFRPMPSERSVDWTLMFDAPGMSMAQRAKKIDGRLARSLIELPVAVTGECEVEEYHSLAVRDLQRGHGVGLPSGEAVARKMGVPPLTREEVGLSDAGWTSETPLWYYILREAAVRANGDRLGPVGGRIVTEVLVGILDRDPASVRSAGTSWRPRYALSELLALTDPTST